MLKIFVFGGPAGIPADSGRNSLLESERAASLSHW